MLTRWTLSQVIACALLLPTLDLEQAKLTQHLLDKLKYCKEVLLSICNVSGSRSENGGGEVSAKLSKALLR
jgi:cell cycle serine/threonine-protein kinase CDC5/MSD2